MEAHARAAIDIYDRILRYAEVEQYGSRYRLLRLGSCDFDFDVAQEFGSTVDDKNLVTVADALREVFTGSVAASLSVTIHPQRCYSFFSPLAATSDADERKVRLQQEAALLAGTEVPLHITADAVHTQTLRSGAQMDWVHVLAIEERIFQRIDQVAKRLSPPRRRLMVAMHAAASTIGRLQIQQDVEADRGPFILAMGWYAGHVEYTLCHGERWYFSKHTDAVSSIDAVYFAAAMLDHLHLSPRQVRRLYVYGNAVDLSDFSDLETMFDLDAQKLNPLEVLDLDPGSLDSDFEVEAYVGCIGAAL
jgi:hypothetical protein